jgi:hypothetical protein
MLRACHWQSYVAPVIRAIHAHGCGNGAAELPPLPPLPRSPFYRKTANLPG